MFTTPRRFGPAIRLALARRPWIRWLTVVAAAALAGWLILGQLQRVEDARQAWTEQRTVIVAAGDHAPGDLLDVEQRRLPAGAIPEAAVDDVEIGALARQRVSDGEVITVDDVTAGAGPAAAADDGEVVVAVTDPLLLAAGSSLSVGLPVAIHSEGIVLAERARIVAIDGEVVFVALAGDEAPSVAAAAQMRLASIAFLP